MTAEVLRSLDLLVLFDDHAETFSTHSIPEATGMTRITTVLSTVLSLAFAPVAAQDFTVAQLKPLADDGNGLAQFELGNMMP